MRADLPIRRERLVNIYPLARDDFITASFADEKEYLAFLKEIQSKSVLRRRPSYDANSRICTLVTCTNAMEGERYVLHGILKSVVYYG